MGTTLILGGGFGGLACARLLRARLAESHRVRLVDRSPRFVVGASKPWIALGERSAEEMESPRASLLPSGVEFAQAEVQATDPARRKVRIAGAEHTAEHLVVALGAELDMTAVPGLADAAHTFYTLEGAVRLREAFAKFPGGRMVLLIPRTPFQCPPAPYESAMLLHAALERRGLREKTDFAVWTVEKAPMSAAGPEMGKVVVGMLEQRGIGFHPMKKAVGVEAARRRVRFEDGAETAYDLLIAVPPHRPPQVVVEAGLAKPDGWIPVDPATLEVKSPGAAAHVYAIGDVTSVALPGRWDPAAPLVLPKAGIFAARQGEVVAGRIAAAAGAGDAPSFDGRGHCYIEVGGGLAMRGDGAFFEMPHPVMDTQPPDVAQYREKLEWVAGWLAPPR